MDNIKKILSTPEDTTNSKPLTQIVSFIPLLGFHFAKKLADSGLRVSLINLAPSPTYLPLPTNNVVQTGNLEFQDSRPDYFCLFYPSRANSAQLERIFDYLSSISAKVLVVDQFETSFFENTDFLNRIPSSRVRRIYLTNPYGDLRFFASPDRIHEILQLSSQGQHLSLPNQGQNLLFPTHISDLLPAMLKILFSSGSDHPVYYLSSLDQVTELDFAYLTQKISYEFFEKSLVLDFHQSHNPLVVPDRSQIAKTQALLDWDPLITPQQGVRLTYQNQSTQDPVIEEPIIKKVTPAQSKLRKTLKKKQQHLTQILQRLTKKDSVRKKSPFLIVALVLLLIFSIPPALLLINAYLGGQQLAKAVSSLEMGETQKARKEAENAKKHLSESRLLLELTNKAYFFLPSEKIKKHQSLLDAGERLSGILLTSIDTTSQAQDLYLGIVKQKSVDLFSLLPSLKANLTQLHTQLALVETSIKDIPFDSKLSYLTPLKQTKEKLPDIRNRLELGVAMIDLLPSTINSNISKKYLFILQDNAELRPTGGFISAFAVLTFQNGQLSDYAVTDIYSADNQLSGKVEPPAPLKAHLESNWYARDSNWSPDFPESARQVQWFLDKEINQSFDGVISIDLFAFQSLLAATGPIPGPRAGETVGADNLFEAVNQRTQIDFSSPSDTGQDFLTKLFSSLLTKLATADVPLVKLTKAVDDSLRQHSLQIALNDTGLQSFIETQNWSGSLRNPLCPVQFINTTCTSETFALIEANLGINKANFYLNRRIEHQVNISEKGSITHQIDVSYQNTSTENQWPGGKYKTYTRLYVPLNSKILEVKAGDEILVTDQQTSVSNSNLLEVGFYHEIPSSSSQVLTIKLESPSLIPVLLPQSSFNINWEKQSGSGPTPLTLTINHPIALKPTLLSRSAATQPGSVKFSTPLDQDTGFAIKLSH